MTSKAGKPGWVRGQNHAPRGHSEQQQPHHDPERRGRLAPLLPRKCSTDLWCGHGATAAGRGHLGSPLSAVNPPPGLKPRGSRWKHGCLLPSASHPACFKALRFGTGSEQSRAMRYYLNAALFRCARPWIPRGQPRHSCLGSPTTDTDTSRASQCSLEICIIKMN